ncbi:MAG: hypothetical protein MUO62_14665, partial [Anaerolineales bacterium]|nr:hypothetical protein [Anaerolineales bacterium]
MSETKQTKPVLKWERAIRWVVNTLVVFIVGITILLGWDTYINGGIRFGSNQNTPIATVILPTQTPAPRVDVQVDLPAYKVYPALGTASLNRVAVLDTEIPVR